MQQNSSFKLIEDNIQDNSNFILKEQTEHIELIQKIFDLQYFIFFEHIKVIDVEPYLVEDNYTRLIGTALSKNMYSFFSAYSLTIDGLVGPARLLFRNIFEFLIISKFTSLSNDISFIEKWNDGKDISLRKDIFSKIIEPNSIEIKSFWKLLCEYTHGTIYSLQIDINAKRYKREIDLNIIYLRMLLEMNYHVLNTHFINKSIAYYANSYAKNFYGIESEVNIYKSYKDELRKLFILSKSDMLKEPKKVINDFKLKWTLKSS